jgi:hypothetical protein
MAVPPPTPYKLDLNKLKAAMRLGEAVEPVTAS